jgi:hypothetical protein
MLGAHISLGSSELRLNGKRMTELCVVQAMVYDMFVD